MRWRVFDFMSTFQSYAQVGQDCFAYGMNGGRPGSFLDIGCGHPTAYSNTYGLEKAGWTGVCVDRYADAAWGSSANDRKARRIVDDARTINWDAVYNRGLIPPEAMSVHVNYLSLDCDEQSYDVLIHLPTWLVFDCCTVEDDRYRLGPSQFDAIKKYMTALGYHCTHPEVLWEGKPFETWWIKS